MLEGKLKVAVMASGYGSNFQAIQDSSVLKEIGVQIVCLVTNNPQAFVIERARRVGIPVEIAEHKAFPTREAYDQELLSRLDKYQPDLICLAGFMRVLSPVFLRAYARRIINIHPSLLPAFPGIRIHEQVIDYGVRYSGCTVHFVDEGVDTGPIILQAAVPVYDDDTPESLATRVHEEEYRIYPEAVRLFAQKRLVIDGRRVKILTPQRA